MNGNGFKRGTGSGAVTFRDRVDTMTRWFREWSPCEQTIAAYSLFYQLSPSHVRFLSTVMDAHMQEHSDEVKQLEGEANDRAFINSLYGSNEEQALENILARLPLLRPDSAAAVKEYMNLLPKVLLGCCEDTTYLDKCRQFLSLALVHPAFKQDDKGNLEYWLRYLDDKWKKVLEKNGVTYGHQQQQGLSKSHTVPKSHQNSEPPSTGGGWPNRIRSSAPWDGSDDRIAITCPPRAVTRGEPTNGSPDNHTHLYGSLSDEDQPGSGGEGGGASKEGGAPQRNTFEEQGSGMSEVPGWLKGLRLHKYQELFQVMSYDEMVSITDEFLEKKGVTKGARNKILQNISSLSQRHKTLSQMEKEIAEAKTSGQTDPRPFISDLHALLKTPMKPFTAPVCSLSGSEEGSQDITASCRSKEGEGPGGGSGGEEGGPAEKEPSGSEDDSSSSSSSPEMDGSDQEQEEYADQLLQMDIPPENLPLSIARVMYRVYDMLYLSPESGVESTLGAFIQMVDQALRHQAFQVKERNLFFEWKQECQKNLRFLCPRRSRNKGYGGFHTFGGVSSRGATGGFGKKPSTIGRPARLKSSGVQSGNRSSTIPRLEQRQTMLGPFAGGVPLTTALPFGAEPSSQGGSLMDRSFSNTQLTGSQGSLSAPRYIKSKACSSDQHMDDLCRRVAAQALSDDPLDGMSISLSGRSSVRM